MIKRYLGNDEYGAPDPHNGGSFVLYDDHVADKAAERERAKVLVEALEYLSEKLHNAVMVQARAGARQPTPISTWLNRTDAALFVYKESEGGE